ncbi:hypothetical protein [Fibrella forsythiae]|uniref:Uncharacterized protein n=1 Tax=Fibrella forsythiae TaxID=2817061 RepID=A0ABS3JDB4_9BACT|nr:hypothetical protein [Fibrella forsythiae]MBO0947981.1 hypothetical protein [Fibrella forsythiae]
MLVEVEQTGQLLTQLKLVKRKTPRPAISQVCQASGTSKMAGRGAESTRKPDL